MEFRKRGADMHGAIKEMSCLKSEDFLNNLSRRNIFGEGDTQYSRYWVFRGQSNDDEYTLVPSALRDNARLGYTYDPKGKQRTNKEQIFAEFERVHEFYWSIDAQGLQIPGDGNLLRTPEGWKKVRMQIENEGWPIDDLLPLLALARHYGVHTRLLDWSDNPLAAAFFAAREAAVKPKGQSFLSVWALNLDWIINDAFDGNRSKKIPVFVVTAPRATNPNLHAQGGIFTTEKLTKADFGNAVSADSVDTIVEKKWSELNARPSSNPARPVMVHMKLPVSEAGKLLRLLNHEQINSATIYPGYQGVADSLKERDYWDKRERVNCWLDRL